MYANITSDTGSDQGDDVDDAIDMVEFSEQEARIGQ